MDPTMEELTSYQTVTITYTKNLIYISLGLAIEKTARNSYMHFYSSFSPAIIPLQSLTFFSIALFPKSCANPSQYPTFWHLFLVNTLS